MGLKVNFSDTESNSFSPIPKGKYHVKVTDYEVKEAGENAKNPGSQYINWECVVQDGAQEGRKLFTNTSLLPHALFALKGLLEATGKWSQEQLDSEDFDLEPDEVIGCDLIAVVELTKYNGDDVNNIKRFQRWNGSPSSVSTGGSVLP